MNDCKHVWRTIEYGPTGVSAAEQVCGACGHIRLTGPVVWVVDMANSRLAALSMRGVDIKR